MEITENELKLFMGKNANYYLNKWQTKNKSWNWAAFLVGIFWMGFRKMYFHSFIFLGVLLVVKILENIYHLNLTLSIVFFNCAFIYLGLFANSLYYNFCKHKILKIKMKYQDLNTQEQEIRRVGGTSPVGLIIIGLGILIYIGIYGYFLSFYE